MFARNALGAAVAALRLDLDAQGLGLGAQDHGAALEQRRVDPRRALERVVARAQHRRPVQPQDVPRQHPRHLERQPHPVPRRDQVREPVDVRRHVVVRLRAQEGQQVLD